MKTYEIIVIERDCDGEIVTKTISSEMCLAELGMFAVEEEDEVLRQPEQHKRY